MAGRQITVRAQPPSDGMPYFAPGIEHASHDGWQGVDPGQFALVDSGKFTRPCFKYYQVFANPDWYWYSDDFSGLYIKTISKSGDYGEVTYATPYSDVSVARPSIGRRLPQTVINDY